MKLIRLPREATDAVATDARRPATAVVHDTPDARLVVFRISPGQSVPPHRSASTVMLSVVSGRGLVSGGDEERSVEEGDVVTYEPNELHGMRATDTNFVLLATIAPRPGERH
jgi:quercetin dioxygenase-like cupin family protein